MLYWQLFWSFIKIGALSFGGGMAMIPIIQQEMTAMGWMTASEITDIVAISEMTPGPLAINAATFAGTRTGGIPGAVAATLGVVLPSLIISLIAARFFFAVRDSKLVGAGMTGIRPAVTGMVGAATLNLLLLSVTGLHLNNVFGTPLTIDVFTLIVAIVAFMLLLKKMSPVLLIVLSGGVGIGWYFVEKLIH